MCMQYEDSGEFFLHFPELKNDFETVKNNLEVLYVPRQVFSEGKWSCDVGFKCMPNIR